MIQDYRWKGLGDENPILLLSIFVPSSFVILFFKHVKIRHSTAEGASSRAFRRWSLIDSKPLGLLEFFFAKYEIQKLSLDQSLIHSDSNNYSRCLLAPGLHDTNKTISLVCSLVRYNGVRNSQTPPKGYPPSMINSSPRRPAGTRTRCNVLTFAQKMWDARVMAGWSNLPETSGAVEIQAYS